MSLYRSIYETLNGSKQLTDRVTVIRPEVLQPEDQMPAIIIKAISVTGTNSLQGDTGNLDQVRYQIDVWSGSIADADEISNIVRKVIQQSDKLKSNFDGRDTVYNESTNRYGVQSDYLIWVTI